MKHIPSETTANILSLLDAGLSARAISSSTRISVGTISNICSQHHPDLPKSSGGRPNLLSPYDLRHCTRLIQSGGANTPAQLAKVVSNMKNIPISSSTICRGLKKSGMKAVVKQKKPYLKAEHRCQVLSGELCVRRAPKCSCVCKLISVWSLGVCQGFQQRARNSVSMGE